jgi:hypothetical protein
MYDPYTLLNVIIEHTKFADAKERIELFRAGIDRQEDAIVLALVGPSGSGKSCLLDQVFESDKPIETEEGVIQGHIRVTVPDEPTPKNMAETILAKLDPNDKDKRYTKAQITTRIQTLLEECQTRAIVLEEFQHFYDSTTERVWERESDWLKNLVEVRTKNDTKRLLIVSGLEDSMKVILQNHQLRNRCKAAMVLPCFSWRNDTSIAEFAECVDVFLGVMRKHMSIPNVDQENMYYRCYCATGGVMRLLKSLFSEVVLYAHKGGKKEVTLDDFDSAYLRYSCATPELRAVEYRPFKKSFQITPTEEIIATAELIANPPKPVPVRGRRTSKVVANTSFVASGLLANAR